MKVLVHWPGHASAPDAIYWVDSTGRIQSHEAEVSYGTMFASNTISQKAADASWSRFFDYLAARNPDTDNWETYDISLATTPVSFLQTLRRAHSRG